jgi:AAA family ATP:ADP antiporter
VLSPRIAVARIVEVRAGEWLVALVSFAVLMLTSGAFTVLETARDALLVTRLPQRDFGVAYIAVAACALPAAAIVARFGQRVEPRTALLVTLVASAGALLLYLGVPIRRASVVALYVTAGLISTTVFPQFWVTVGTLLTAGQSRRLLGPIASAGVLGSVAGAAVAAAVVPVAPIRALLVIAAVMFLAAAGAALLLPSLKVSLGAHHPAPRGEDGGQSPGPRPTRERSSALTPSIDAFREEPFLVRVALLVAITTATALVIDYFFKWTIARALAPEDRGPFIARYYVLVNGAALVIQIFLGSTIVRGLGVSAAMVITPFLSLLGGMAALIAGAVAMPVLLLKAVDGSLRSSINRLTTELAYLPVSMSGRERAKPLIDGALLRVVQALTAGVLLALSGAHLLSHRVFSALVVVLAIAWLLAAIGMRLPYLAQLRRSVAPLPPGGSSDFEPLDLASAELLVEHLGSDEPLMVIAAMNTLVRRGRPRLVPALLLRHTDERVLQRALEIFGATPRTDWYTMATRLLEHSSERVRIAAARALATHGKLDARRLVTDCAPSVRGYATLLAALIDGPQDILDDPRVEALLNQGQSARLGMLAAVADAPSSGRVWSVLVALADSEGTAGGAVWADLLARATVRHRAMAMIPRLIARLGSRAGRESIRDALVALGEPALEQVSRALDDPKVERGLRIHLPRTLARFGTKWAADRLLECIERDSDGLVRYKSIRALARLVVDHGVRVDRVRVERRVGANLVVHFGLLGLRVALGAPPTASGRQPLNTHRLLTGLLDDKLRQSLERAFRLLKIAHPKEDIHRVYAACISGDKRARANAGEFLDALLRRHDQRSLRELVRLVSDDLPPEEQVTRAAALVGIDPPRSPESAVRAALADADRQVAALAALHVAASGGESPEASMLSARERWPSLGTAAGRPAENAPPVRRGVHA